jgi:hypothetical protein
MQETTLGGTGWCLVPFRYVQDKDSDVIILLMAGEHPLD